MSWRRNDKARLARTDTAAAFETLRGWIEQRAQYVENLGAAIADERARLTREEFEARAQEAAAEAKAYASQGLQFQAAAVRALGHVVAELTRDNKRLARDRDDLGLRLAACEAAISGLTAPAGVDSAPAPAAATAAARVHFDASGSPLADFLNIDLPAGNHDILARMKSRGLVAGTAREVVASRVAEHFSERALAVAVLPYWRDLLDDGGQLSLICFDGEALLAHARADNLTFDGFRAAACAGEAGGAPPRWISPDEIKSLLERTGFGGVEIASRGRSRAGELVFRVTARRIAK